MNSKITIVLILGVLLFTTQAQGNDTGTTAIAIDIGKTYTVDLEDDQTAVWTLTFGNNTPKDKDLFVTVQSPSNDPLQLPYVAILVGEGQVQRCDSASDEFSGICRIDRSQISDNLRL